MSTEKKLTAVEWLVIEIEKLTGLKIQEEDVIQQAKEKEKQQIIEAGETALQTDFYVKYESVEDCYNKTFK
jgi:hypothetical protein